MSKRIFTAMPCYSGQVGVHTTQSLLCAQHEAAKRGWEMSPYNFYARQGDADVSCARNVLMQKFRSTDCTDLFYVDSDVSWAPGDFEQLFSHDVDFVGGIYRQKSDDVESYSVEWPEKRELRTDPGSGKSILAVKTMAGGMWRLSRACVEKMVENEPSYFFDKDLPGVKIPWVFEFFIDKPNHIRRSEDVNFCNVWHKLGGKIWVDPLLRVDHTGSKVYKGFLLEALRRESLIAQAAAKAIIPGQRTVLEMAKDQLAGQAS